MAFEDLDEVLRVADLCVMPARGNGLSWLTPKCIASGLPFIAPDSPELRSMADYEALGQLVFRDGDVEHLRERVAQWLDSPQPFRQSILRAREQSVAQSSVSSAENPLLRCFSACVKV